MAYKIKASDCTVCGACEAECPSEAISFKKGTYVIDASKCTECAGQFDSPAGTSLLRPMAWAGTRELFGGWAYRRRRQLRMDR